MKVPSNITGSDPEGNPVADSPNEETNPASLTKTSVEPKPKWLESLKYNSTSTAKAAVIWLGIGFVTNQFIRAISNLILIQFLAPEAFGMMVPVTIFMVGLNLFSDIGLDISIINSKKGDSERFLNTAWTIQILRGFLLTMASSLLAWPYVYSLNKSSPELVRILVIIGFSSAISGFVSTSIYTFSRHLRRSPLVLLGLVTSIVGFVTSIIWVKFISADAWALVAGNLVSALFNTCVSHFILPGFRNLFCWDKTSADELIHFGKWVFFNTALFFLAEQFDRLLVTRLEDFDHIAFYQVANQLGTIPTQLSASVFSAIILPIYSKQLRSDKGIGTILNRIQPLFSDFSGLVSTLLVVVGPLLVACLFGSRYERAENLTRIFGTVCFFRILYGSCETALYSLGLFKISAIGQTLRLFGMIILMPTGYYFYGLNGLAIGYAFVDMLRYFFFAVYLRRQGLSPLRVSFQSFIAALIIGFISLFFLTYTIPSLEKWQKLFCGSAVIFLLWGTFFLLFRKNVSLRFRP